MKIEIESNLLRYVLRDAYFITGTAYAGKSTAVRLLAERHGGICCGENYHEALSAAIDPEHQPNLSYFDTMSGWPEFLSRTPEQYDAWIVGGAREAAGMELLLLTQLAVQGKKLFVDTNLPLETLHAIASPNHVAVMVCPQSMSVGRFFDRPDAEKQFLYQQLLAMPNPDAALDNYRRILEKINSPEVVEGFLHSGFFTLMRDEGRTPEETLRLLEQHFQLN